MSQPPKVSSPELTLQSQSSNPLSTMAQTPTTLRALTTIRLLMMRAQAEHNPHLMLVALQAGQKYLPPDQLSQLQQEVMGQAPNPLMPTQAPLAPSTPTQMPLDRG